jgi:hypothetical protein
MDGLEYPELGYPELWRIGFGAFPNLLRATRLWATLIGRKGGLDERISGEVPPTLYNEHAGLSETHNV